MTTRHFLKTFCAFAIASCALPVIVNGQAYKDAVGFTQLLAEKGAELEDGSIITVMQAEAPNGSGGYMPNVADGQFGGKTFNNGTGTSSGSNSHATSVGRNLYGNSSSMTAGISNITGYDANDFLNRVLNFGDNDNGGDPLPQGFHVGNHSYIANGLPASEVIGINRRFDFLINRDNTLMVVGANNNSANATPDLLAPSYNAITVGLTSGNHSRGVTRDYGPGRFKPDIVAPAGATSFSTPIVGSAAALLRHQADGTNAERNEVIKSALFAGATKEEFANWDRTTTRPIDEVYGHGELNVYNSYKIIEGGEFDGSLAEPATDIGEFGWDLGSFDGSNDLFYNFSIADGLFAEELSASLVWNIDVIDSNPDSAVFDATTSLANLDLELYDSSGSFLGSLVDSSLSTLYNNEHIYFQNLEAGDYTFRVSGDRAVDFGFAWRITAVPEPGTAGLLLIVGTATSLVRRRKKLVG